MQGVISIEEQMKPLKEIYPDWWTLKWKSVKGKTWNLYSSSNGICTRRTWMNNLNFGLWWDFSHFSNYGASHNRFDIVFRFRRNDYHFWFKWNFTCHRNGRNDLGRKGPLRFNGEVTTK